jgi:hypothetical protein
MSFNEIGHSFMFELEMVEGDDDCLKYEERNYCNCKTHLLSPPTNTI